MRIAQFTSSLIEPLGGAEQYCLSIARHQKAHGHDVEVVTGWADSSVRAALEAEGIPVRVIPTSRPYSPDKPGGSRRQKLHFHAVELLDSVRRTAATTSLERAAYDVVHVHRFAGFGTGVLRVRGARVVHTVHDYTLVDTSASLVRDGELISDTSKVQKARAALIISGLSPQTTLIFPSARTRDRHTEFGFPTAAFDSRVIAHGWPEPAPIADADRLQPTSNVLNALFLGKLSEHKGVPMMLDAWGDGIPGVVLRVGGDGALAADVAARPGVEALGWLDERRRTAELERADVLVFPSQWPENFPIVVAEAILAGTSVLTTTVASPPLVDEGESGLLVEPTAAALRGALDRLAKDPALLAELAAGAAKRARQLDIDVHGEAIIAAYQDLL
ncbi:MAG: glycosyltransferase [Glaciihabitans sp.]|nr:glycosyltransferase [Glaciihabitans sp.]